MSILPVTTTATVTSKVFEPCCIGFAFCQDLFLLKYNKSGMRVHGFPRGTTESELIKWVVLSKGIQVLCILDGGFDIDVIQSIDKFIAVGCEGIILFGGLGALRKHKCKSVDFTAIRFGSALKPNTPEVIIASQTAVSSGRSAPVYIVTEEVRDLLREQDDGLPSMLEAIRLAELITIKASISSIARAVRVCRDYQGMPRYPVLEEWVRYLVIQNKFSLKNKRHVGKLIRLCRSVMPNGTYYNDVNIRKVLKYIQDHPKP